MNERSRPITETDAPVHTVSLDLGAALQYPSRCPSCGSERLYGVDENAEVVFTCPACGSRRRPLTGTLGPGRPAGPVPPQREAE